MWWQIAVAARVIDTLPEINREYAKIYYSKCIAEKYGKSFLEVFAWIGDLQRRKQ